MVQGRVPLSYASGSVSSTPFFFLSLFLFPTGGEYSAWAGYTPPLSSPSGDGAGAERVPGGDRIGGEPGVAESEAGQSREI